MAAEPTKMTIKQTKWLAAYLESGNATDAAAKVYDVKDRGSAWNIGSENVRKLEHPMRALMEARGLDANYLIDKLAEGLEANRTISAISMQKGNKEQQANGGTVDFVDVPDMATRHKYLETAGRWFEVVMEKFNGVERPNQQLTINFSGGTLDQQFARIFGGSDPGGDESQAPDSDPAAAV